MAAICLIILLSVLALNVTATKEFATPTTCDACRSADMVWCYHDDMCYPHGSGTDRLPFACPGTDLCASNENCACTSCDDKSCQMKIPNAASCDDGSACDVAGQYCPPSATGATAPNGDCCTDGKWIVGVCGAPAPKPVEQVHLALGLNAGEMNVAYVTYDLDHGNSVSFWQKGGHSTTAVVQSDHRNLDNSGKRITRMATMANLTRGVMYEYQVSGLNQTFHFTFRRARATNDPDRHIIFGDMGSSHAFSLCSNCTATSTTCDVNTCAKSKPNTGLISEIETADMFLHVGDFAYNFDSDGGAVGDQFMRNIEQVAAYIPYMVSHGNHEDTPNNLAHFVERFRNMPTNSIPSNFVTLAGVGKNNLYYSWDAGLVHYIALSTELWFGVTDLKTDRKTQLAWLEQDLIKANANRQNVPWVIAHGHRDIYCTTGDDNDCDTPGDAGTVRKDLEPLFFKYGLDLWINGHEHSYERTFPLYNGSSDRSNVNPKATIYIVTGAAGSQEMHEGFDKDPPSWSAFRSNTFGYSRALVHNHTHLQWQQVQTDPTLFPDSDYGRIIDDVMIVQNKHGPFNISEAPKGTAWPRGDSTANRTHDHFAPLLGLEDDGTNKSTCTLIREFKNKYGEAAYAKKEDDLLKYINDNVGGHTVWEDVRDSGSSTGSWFKWKGGHA